MNATAIINITAAFNILGLKNLLIFVHYFLNQLQTFNGY